jgi:uncharacterized protein (DUF2062 family)
MRRFLKKYLPDPETIRSNPWLRPFQSSLLHPRLWHLNRHSAAGAVATGLFCGLIPGPLQMIGAALAAVKFRINLPLALLVTLYTNPFTIVPLYLVAYQLGRLLTGDSAGFLAPPEFSITAFAAWTEAMQGWMLVVAKPLGLGLLALASALSVCGYLADPGGLAAVSDQGLASSPRRVLRPGRSWPGAGKALPDCIRRRILGACCCLALTGPLRNNDHRVPRRRQQHARRP